MIHGVFYEIKNVRFLPHLEENREGRHNIMEIPVVLRQQIVEFLTNIQ